MRNFIDIITESVAETPHLSRFIDLAKRCATVDDFIRKTDGEDVLYRGHHGTETLDNSFMTDYVGHAEAYADDDGRIDAYAYDQRDVLYFTDQRFDEMRFRYRRLSPKELSATYRSALVGCRFAESFSNALPYVRKVISSDQPYSDFSGNFEKNDALIPLMQKYARDVHQKNIIAFLGGDFGEYGGQNEFVVGDISRLVNLRKLYSETHDNTDIINENFYHGLPGRGSDWQDAVWGFWIRPSDFAYYDCDASTHTIVAIEEMGIVPPEDYDPENDLENDEVIAAVIAQGWVRGRYEYQDLVLNGKQRDCQRIAAYFFDSGKFPFESLTMDFSDGKSVRLRGDDAVYFVQRGYVPRILVEDHIPNPHVPGYEEAHALIIHYGKVYKFHDLPPLAQKSVAQYMGQNCEQEIEQYAADDREYIYGVIPMQVLKDAIMNCVGGDVGEDWDNFEEYHAWYKEGPGMKNHRNVWPIILGMEIIEDGWHRFHGYVTKGLKEVPAVWCL